MTRDATFQLPSQSASVLGEIKMRIRAGDLRGAVRDIVLCLNAFYELDRGCIVDDKRSSDLLTSTTSQALNYRTKAMGFGGLTDETLEALVWVDRSHGGAGPFDANLSIQCVNGGTASAEINADAATTGFELVTHGAAFAAYDSLEYEEFKVTLTTLANVTLQLQGLYIGYERAKTALTIGPTGQIGYSNNGFIPLDTAMYDTGDPVSVWRLFELLTNTWVLYARAAGPIGTAAWYAAVAPTLVDNYTRISAARPPGVTLSRWWFLAQNTSGRCDVHSKARDETTSVAVSGAGWIEVEVDHGDALHVFENERFTTGGETTIVESICGYWVDP